MQGTITVYCLYNNSLKHSGIVNNVNGELPGFLLVELPPSPGVNLGSGEARDILHITGKLPSGNTAMNKFRCCITGLQMHRESPKLVTLLVTVVKWAENSLQ